MLISVAMARRPDREKAEKLTEQDLKELRHKLAHLSVTAIRDFYEQAYQDCRLVYNRLMPQCRIIGHSLSRRLIS
jgi:hypothetical protein